MWEVVWSRDAESQLAAIWLAARDRQRLAEVSERIDRTLRTDPMTAGESRQSKSIRVLFDDPLEVSFIVDVGKAFVEVAEIRRTR